MLTLASKERLERIFLRCFYFGVFSLLFFLPLIFLPISGVKADCIRYYGLIFLLSFSVISYFLQKIFSAENNFRRTPIDWLLFFFLVVNVFSASISSDVYNSFWSHQGVFYLLLICAFFLAIASDKKSFFLFNYRRVFISLSASYALTVLLSGAMIYIFIAGGASDNLLLKIGWETGGFEIMSLSLVFFSLLFSGVIALHPRMNFGLVKLLFMDIVLSLSLAMLTLANFNLAWISMLLGSLLLINLYFFDIRRQPNGRFYLRKIIWPTFFIIISSAFLMMPTSKIFDGVQDINRQLPKRTQLPYRDSYTIVKQAVAKKIFWGNGPDNFDKAFSEFRPQRLNNTSVWQFRFKQAPSYLLQLAVEIGVVGLLCYLLILAISSYLVYHLHKNVYFSSPDAYFLSGVAGPLLLVVLLWQIMYESNFKMQFLLFFLLAFIFDLWPKKAGSGLFYDRVIKRPLVMIINTSLVVIFAILGYFFSRNLLADWNFYSGNVDGMSRAVEINGSQYLYLIKLSNQYLRSALDGFDIGKDDVAGERISRAISLAKRAAYLAPQSVVASENMAVIYRDSGPFLQNGEGMAITWFEKSLNLEPSNPVLATELGKAYLRNKQLVEAEKYFKLAISLKSDYYDASFGLAKVYAKTDKEKDALTILEELERVVDDPEVFYEDGRLSYNTGDYGRSVKKFQAAIKVAPSNVNALYGLGLSYEMIGKDKDALYNFRRALNFDPDNVEIRNKVDELTRK